MNIYLAIALIFIVSSICFLIGLSLGSAGKASEREEALSVIAKLEHEKVDLDERLDEANDIIKDLEEYLDEAQEEIEYLKQHCGE